MAKIIHSLRKVITLIKESYTPKLVKFIVVFFSFGLVGTLLAINYQHQEISDKKIQIEQEYKQAQQQNQKKYNECLQQEETRLKNKNNDYFYFSPCFMSNLDAILTHDSKLSTLKEFEQKLESGYYYLYSLLCISIIIGIIPTVHILILTSKYIYRKSMVPVISLKASRVHNFQTYSLILSGLILISLIVVIIILLT